MPEVEEDKKVKAAEIKKFFGLKEGQSLTDFMGELKELTQTDKEQLTAGIVDGSLTY